MFSETIDTSHALLVLKEFLSTHIICCDLEWEPVYEAIEIIMRKNVFQFSDKYFLQLCGTAMGTPPAPSYATLYFGIHELKTLKKFSNNLLYYKRYIDDVFGIWIPSQYNNNNQWYQFQKQLNEFGILRWEFSKLSDNNVFLDLKISINNNKIVTTLYEKSINLYLYPSPLSAHPPHCIKGTIIGMIIRYKKIISQHDKFIIAIKNFFQRLLHVGYPKNFLLDLFNSALNYKKLETKLIYDTSVFFHIPFNPGDPTSNQIQRVFKNTMFSKNNLPTLDKIPNARLAPMGIKKLIIAYSKQKSIRNFLFPRRFDATEGPSASSYLRSNEFSFLFKKMN